MNDAQLNAGRNALPVCGKASADPEKADARFKVYAVLIYLLTVALMPAGAWAALILLAAVLLSAIILARTPAGLLIKRACAIEAAIVMVALPLLVRAGGRELLAFKFAGIPLTVTESGTSAFFTVLLKSWLSILASALLITSTRFEHVISALQGLGFPKLMAAVLQLMWRYLFLLQAEARRLMMARAARSGRPASQARQAMRPFWQVKVTGRMAGSLLLRSMERSERVYQAMKARGYDGSAATAELPDMDRQQHRKTAIIALCALLVLLLAHLIY